MIVKTMGTCRGDGKIYTKLSIRGKFDSTNVAITAMGKHGEQIPCNIYQSLINSPRSNDASSYFIAVFPILDIKTGSFTIFDRSSQEIFQRIPLNFSKAKWESRLNYKINRRLCEEIRGFDKVGTYSNAHFEYWECIDDTDSCILRGAVTMPYHDDSALSIMCFDRSCKPIHIEPVILSDTKTAPIVANDAFLREIQVSIRLPKPVTDVFFVMRDENHPELNSFNSLPADKLFQLIFTSNTIMMNAQVDPSYPSWLKGHQASIDVLAKESITFFPHRPRYSIVVPLYNTPEPFFEDMIRSVINQSYGKWELILVNASPDNPSLSRLVREASKSDERIKLITLAENRGISENTNAGIAAATGDFVCFFDHDDVIEPNLLFEYTKAVNRYKDIDLLYCDEDKLMPDGTYAQPFFKPDFNLDLLRNNNYICHLLTIRKSLLDSLPPNTREFDGAQDHNLTLQAIEKARRVHHVPLILYHWRLSETSTAANAESKPYATKAGIRSVQAHLDRMGIKARVSRSRRPFTYRIQYEIPNPHPLVSILIPTKDHVEVLNTCIQSILRKSTYDNYEIILIENNSNETDTFEYYRQITSANPNRVRVVTWTKEFNFSKLINFGAQNAHGDYLLLLNNDTEIITPNWIEELLGNCARPDVGIVGCRLYYRDNTIQHAGVCVTGGAAGHLGKNLPRGQWGYFAFADAAQNLSAVTAACMLTKRSAFEAVNGFTEKLAVAFNDIDYCLKIRELGLLVVYTPEAELYHYESLSRGYETNIEKQIRFHKEVAYMNYHWADYYVKGDPYINSNITRTEPFNYYYHL